MDLGIDGIEDVEPIGSGGSAAVYRARQPRLGRTVAVKVLNGTAGDKIIRRFEREARALGTLSEHRGIVTVYEAGTTDADHPYLIMQYCSGGSLQDLIDQGQPMPAARARELIAQVATTLAVAHERGVIHRDLKPANLLIDGSGQAVVADFGIAALSHAANGVTASILFTPGFASPESLRGDPPTAEGDVYSLGATLYALMTAKVPFASPSEQTGYAVAIKAMSEDLPDTRQFGVPNDIAEVIRRATSRTPSERPTMNDIALMLRGGHVAPARARSAAEHRGPDTLTPIAPLPSAQPPSAQSSASQPPQFTDPATTQMPGPVPEPRPVQTPTAAPLRQPFPEQGSPGASRWALVALALALLGVIAGAFWLYASLDDDTVTQSSEPAADLNDTATGDADSGEPPVDIAPTDVPADLDPLGLCDAGSTLIQGGESQGAPNSDGDVRAAICRQPSGALEYFGLETAGNLSIRLPACMSAPGRFIADNDGSVYTVTSDLASASPSVSLVSPAGVQQFDYVFDSVFVGDGATGLSIARC